MDDWHGRHEMRDMTPIEIVCAVIAIGVVIAVCIFGPQWTVMHWR